MDPPPPQLYSSLPQSVPPRVLDLAASIARGAESNARKADVLEAYLRSNYVYGSFDAGDGDAAEAFLLAQRRGGSEQFASALALMLRAVGIPSRIVLGYRARRLNPWRGEFEIWEADRHCWVEAYVDQRWTAFEPSP